jgi:hypothetical protein
LHERSRPNFPLFSFQNYIIQNLLTFTQYLVSLQVFNPEGLGPPTTVAVITDESGKSHSPQPSNFKVEEMKRRVDI